MARTIDELGEFSVAGSGVQTVTFLPEPEPQTRYYTVISVDDHVVEPKHTWEGRLPKKFADRAPRVVEENGSEVWLYEGVTTPNIGFNAVVGRPVSEYSFDPVRFDQMRRGSWDIDARIHDMDIAGVYASMCFPSGFPGFAGQRLQVPPATNDPELALAVVRGWNDWLFEEWASAYPDRIIPSQLAYLLDPVVAADEVRRNAERGFKALIFTEGPHALGLPSIHTDHWDPLMRACEETETAVCIHIGSSGTGPAASPDAPIDVTGTLFSLSPGFAAVDWLFSKIPVRFPEIKIVLSEGGLGWVPAVLDRLQHQLRYQEMFEHWNDVDLTPAEVLRRNFYHCATENPLAWRVRDAIGIDRITIEVDYPHADSTWPDCQQLLHEQLAELSPEEVRLVTWENASRLFKHPVPEAVQSDPNAF